MSELIDESELIDAAELGNINIVRQLLDRGVDPDFQEDDCNGDAALITASRNGFINIVGLLLNRGANPNIQDIDGDSALLHASEYGHIEIVNLLLNRGAIPNIQNRLGITPLRVAVLAENTDIERLLRRHMRSTRIQSRFRGKRTRKARTQKATQRLSMAKSMEYPSTYSRNSIFEPGIAEMISEYLSQLPYRPEISIRMREEERDEANTDSDDDYSLAYDDGDIPVERRNSQAQRQVDEYLDTLAQFGGSRRRRTRRKKYQYY